MLRAVGIANPSRKARTEAERLLCSCLLVDVSDAVLRAAVRLASREMRTLDAVHVASAELVGADEVLAYDSRLAAAARHAGFVATGP